MNQIKVSGEAVNRNRKRNGIRNRNSNRGRYVRRSLTRNRKEKLYICCQEENMDKSCYFIRAIDLEALMSSSCSCDFNHEKGEETKCPMSHMHDHDDVLRRVGLLCGDVYDVPNAMGCGPFGSQVVFLGGELAPFTRDNKPSKKVYAYDIIQQQQQHEEEAEAEAEGEEEEEMRAEAEAEEEEEMRAEAEEEEEEEMRSIKELDSNSSSLANIDHGIYCPRLIKIKGDLYALAVDKYEMSYRYMGDSLVYRAQSQRWEVLPVPMTRPIIRDFLDSQFSLLVTENRIFMSMLVMASKCFDTETNCWIDCSSKLPFLGETVVVDLDTDQKKEKLVFACGYNDIRVWRLGLTDDLNVSYFKRIGSLNLNPRLVGLFYHYQHRLIDLGGGKICFVIFRPCRRVEYNRYEDYFEKVCVIIILFKYEFDPAAPDEEALRFKFLRTRTFIFTPHCTYCTDVRLLNCFVR